MKENILANMIGQPTGFYYEGNGSPVLVGDKISLRDVTVPVTVRVRKNNKSQELYFYTTYTIKNRTYTQPMRRIAEVGFRPYKRPERVGWIEQRMADEGKKPHGGKVIVGLEDYDHAIYK